MICPACQEDYRISAAKKQQKKKDRRITIGVLPNDFNAYQISGMACPNCGYVAEMIKHPTGNPFYKGEEITNPEWIYNKNQYRMFLEEKGMLTEFENFIKEWKEKKIAESQK